MKFRITKGELERMTAFFSKKDADYAELELEPFDLTAAQAIREAKIREEGYVVGHRQGYQEAHEEAGRMRLAGGYCTCGYPFDHHLNLCRKCYALLGK